MRINSFRRSSGFFICSRMCEATMKSKALSLKGIWMHLQKRSGGPKKTRSTTMIRRNKAVPGVRRSEDMGNSPSRHQAPTRPWNRQTDLPERPPDSTRMAHAILKSVARSHILNNGKIRDSGSWESQVTLGRITLLQTNLQQQTNHRL